MNLFLLQGRHGNGYFCRMPEFIRSFIFILLFVIFVQPCIASSQKGVPHWSRWGTAKTFYDQKDYSAALQELLKDPGGDFTYFYNLGTLYTLVGKPGLAVAYLEKANRLHPHDPDIQYNLSLSRAHLSESIGPTHLDPASTWTEQLADRISLDEVRATLGLIGFIVVAFWIRAYLQTRNLRKVLAQPSGFLGLLGFAITLSLYGIQRWASSYPPAICIESQVIRSGPGNHYLDLSHAEVGTKVRILGSSLQGNNEIWEQVRYSDDGIGWIKSSSLLLL
jgi:tetratricopeptide (TPR) repeat protein